MDVFSFTLRTFNASILLTYNVSHFFYLDLQINIWIVFHNTELPLYFLSGRIFSTSILGDTWTPATRIKIKNQNTKIVLCNPIPNSRRKTTIWPDARTSLYLSKLYVMTNKTRNTKFIFHWYESKNRFYSFILKQKQKMIPF